MSHRPTTAGRDVTGPSTVGWRGVNCSALVMCVSAGRIMGSSSEMSGNRDAMGPGIQDSVEGRGTEVGSPPVARDLTWPDQGQ